MAQQNPAHFPGPTKFSLQRENQDADDSGEYIIYGRKKGAPFTAKHLTIIAVTSLIKQAAKLNQLRRAHDTEGRLGKVKTPDGVERYLTQESDQLVPFPTSTSIPSQTPSPYLSLRIAWPISLIDFLCQCYMASY